MAEPGNVLGEAVDAPTGDPTNRVPPDDRIQQLQAELEEVRNRLLISDVNYENQLHSSKSQISKLTSQLQKANEDLQVLKNSDQTAETSRTTLHADYLSLKSEHEKSLAQIDSYRVQLASLQDQQRNTNKVLERKIAEADRLDEEYKSLSTKLSETRRENNELHRQVAESKGLEMTFKVSG